jgi:hypothetical protein
MYSSYMPFFPSQQPRSVAASYHHEQNMYRDNVNLISRTGNRAQQLLKHPYHTPNSSSLPPIPPSGHCGNNNNLMYEFTAAAAAAAAATVNMTSGNDMSYGSLDIDRGVKRRRRLTQEETSLLNDIFERTSKPNALVRKMLAERLNMSPRTVQIWFQNRRAKVKKDGKGNSPINGTDSSGSTSGDSPNSKSLSDSGPSLSRSTSTSSATTEATYKLVSQDQRNIQDTFTPSLQSDGVANISDWSAECDWAFQAMGYSSPGKLIYVPNKESPANPTSASDDAESDTTATTASSGQPWSLDFPLGSCDGENYLGIHRLRSHEKTGIKCQQEDLPFTPPVSASGTNAHTLTHSSSAPDWFPECGDSNYLLGKGFSSCQ